MPRYFIEVSYKGTKYAGFQVQKNAVTIQSEVEKALGVCFRKAFSLTGSSRTDAGVHALQNFFHFDSLENLWESAPTSAMPGNVSNKSLYSLNSVLPADIVISDIFEVEVESHCRFSALSREYKYQLYRKKDPFLKDVAFYYPYKIDLAALQQASEIVLHTVDFTSFSKRNTQVKNFNCSILKSHWYRENDLLIYNVIGNRFLRGMVRGLVGTMLRVGSGKISVDQLREIIKSKDCAKADFSVPGRGLFLARITYPDNILNNQKGGCS